MFYSYDDNSVIQAKSTEPFTVSDYACSDEDFDLELYDVTIGFIDEESKEILKNTKKLKGAEAVITYLQRQESRQAEVELDIDFRLSMIELGLI